MADHLDLPANWYGHRARVGGSRYRVRLWCDQLESRDATGSIVSGVVAAAFGAPLSDSMSELARLIGDWAFLDGAARTSPPAGPIAPSADESPRKLTRYDTWLEPDLLFPEERTERGVRVTAPTAPANSGRGAFGDLLGEQPHLSGPTNFGPFPSFVGVRAAPVFASESPQSPRSVVNGAAAAVAGQDTETLPFGVRLAVNADERDAPIPNESPIAVDDTVSVDEDGSVVFDPTTNDVDLDYDPLWVKSVQAETPNGRTYWEEGGYIRYIPNPDYENTSSYYGPDSFTYTVTDGLAEATGTVSVTVTAVNDAPVAANDAVVYINPFTYPPYGDPDEWNYYYDAYTWDLTANDIDYDGTLSHVEVDTTGALGTIDVAPEGNFATWQYRWDFQGHTDFKYRVVDDEGAASAWATVRFIADRNPVGDGPAPVAVADVFAVGDEEVSGNVTTNDSGSSYAVLTSQPASGRLTAFNTDGSFKYLADHTRQDATFGYWIFSANGEVTAAASADLTNVNLTLHHGQNGKSVRELNERLVVGGAAGGNPLIPAFKATGAFTVANQNDSDVDNSPDAFDADVPAKAGFAGSGEKDLMKLVMSKPAAVAGFNDVILSVASASTPGVVPAVNFWKVPTKGNQPQPLGADGKAAIPVNAIPAELWVEMTGVSPAIGDVSIKMEYAGATDTVNATGIWTKHDQAQTHQWPDGYFMNAGAALPADADARGIRGFFDDRGKVLGLAPNIPHETKAGWFYTRNNELSKFTVLPSGMTPISVLGIVSFDATRSAERKTTVTFQPGGAKSQDIQRPPWLEVANDESPILNDDNDNDLLYSKDGRPASTDNIYSWDAPGTPAWESKGTGVYISPTVRLTEVVGRDNYFDFVRVSFGTPWIPGQAAGVQGSRSSVYYAWSNMLHIRETDPAEFGPPLPGALWTMTRTKDPGTVTENRIEKGHININVAGGGVT